MPAEGTTFEEFVPDLRKLIQCTAANPDDQEDLLQEILLRLRTNLPRLRRKESLKAWAYRIARHV